MVRKITAVLLTLAIVLVAIFMLRTCESRGGGVRPLALEDQKVLISQVAHLS